MRKPFLVILMSLILLFFFSCEPEPTELASGAGNYNFSGKTLSGSNDVAWIKKTEVSGSTTTTTYIPILSRTRTFIFNADKTFIYTDKSAYASGIDGTFTDGGGITYTYYDPYGTGFGNGVSASGHSWSGFAGKAPNGDTQKTYTGTWDTMTAAVSQPENVTLLYILRANQEIIQTDLFTVNPGGSAIYSLTNSSTSTRAMVGDEGFAVLNYRRFGTSSFSFQNLMETEYIKNPFLTLQ